jgi:hypothetical protein
LGLHASISGSNSAHCVSVSIAPPSQKDQNARIQKRFKVEQAAAYFLSMPLNVKKRRSPPEESAILINKWPKEDLRPNVGRKRILTG